MASDKYSGVVFRVINQDVINRLINDGVIEVPQRKVSVPKDERWNEKLMASKIMQGIQNGDSVQKIAKSLESVVGTNNNSAIRMARTMVTSAENRGRLDSYKALEKQGVIMKKEWMATPDDRTRPSHRDLDGEEQDLDHLFSNGCMYPGDGRGPADEVWMCRCSMRSHIVGRRKSDGTVKMVNYGRDLTSHEEQMKAYKKVSTSTVTKVSYEERIKAIAEDAMKNGLTAKHVYEAGHIMAEEVNADIETARQNYENAKAGYEKARAELDRVSNDPKYRQACSAGFDVRWNGADISTYGFKTVEEAEAYRDAVAKEIARLQNDPKYQQARKAYQEAYSLYNGGNGTAESLKNRLSAVREMGADGIDLKYHLQNSRSKTSNDVKYAYDLYPRSWVEKSVAKGTMKVGKKSRGYYDDYNRELMISGIAGSKSSLSTSVHELGHRFEKSVPEILSQEKEFYEKRTVGESLEWLGSPYKKSEKTRKDDFLDEYMGKDYGGRAYELVSMGFQYAYYNPTELAKDKDMQEWILGLLSIVQ